jgi:tryptophan-rich sensory protein
MLAYVVIAPIPFVGSALVRSLYPYDTTQPPPPTRYQPPSWVFGFMWTLIYATFGIYMVRAQNEPARAALNALVALNLLANWSWTPLVFAHKRYTAGLVVILALVALLLAKITLTQDSSSRALLVPYIAWLSVASSLSGALLERS